MLKVDVTRWGSLLLLPRRNHIPELTKTHAPQMIESASNLREVLESVRTPRHCERQQSGTLGGFRKGTPDKGSE